MSYVKIKSINKINDKKKRQGGNNQTFHSFPESIYIDRIAFIPEGYTSSIYF